MKRIVIASCLVFSFLVGAWPAQASYKEALILVREGKWSRAMGEFEKLVKEGHAPSMFSLGLIYHLGRGVPRDLEKAYNLYKQSALGGHAPGVNNLGMMYLNGEHVAQNRFIAFKLFEKASAEHAQAKDNLGQCFEHGWGIEADPEQAINFFQLAGDEGYKLGYFHLAQFYENGGAGTKPNIQEAIRWYQAAGEDGFIKGYIRAAEIYEQGVNGIKVDLEKTLYYYQQAADLNYRPAVRRVEELKKKLGI